MRASPFCVELQTVEMLKDVIPFSSHKLCQLHTSDILSIFDKQEE